MGATAIIIAGAGILTAITTIVATSGRWGKSLSILMLRVAINHLRNKDIDPDSLVGIEMRKNDSIEAHLAEIRETLESMDSAIERSRVSDIRIELLLAVHNTPEKVDVIEHLYHKYMLAGGNSYVTRLIEEWREAYARKIVQQQIMKK